MGVVALAERGNDFPPKVSDEGRPGGIVRGIRCYGAEEKGKLPAITQDWGRRTKGNLEQSRGEWFIYVEDSKRK